MNTRFRKQFRCGGERRSVVWALAAMAISAGLMIVVGCTSIRSTMLNRTESGAWYANSDGADRWHGAARPYRGVPITLRVPTHVDVIIEEKLRFSVNEQTGELHQLASTTERPHLSVRTDLIYTDKVFMVDVKRPAAGEAEYTFEFGGVTEQFDNRQYFSEIRSRITDRTIRDITAALATVLEAVPAVEELPVRMTQVDPLLFFDQTRTVAWKRFDVDAADVELQIAAFVDHHLNPSCQTCLVTP